MVWTVACNGSIGAPLPSLLAVSSSSTLTCNPTQRGPSAPLVRLTTLQYRNTLEDLVAATFENAAVTSQVMATIEGDLAALPPVQRGKSGASSKRTFGRLDQGITQPYVDATMNIAMSLAAALTAPQRIGMLLGGCGTDSSTANDDDCLRTLIRTFGGRALRHPLSEDDVTFYRNWYGTDSTIRPLRVALVVAALLSAPDFLYLVESGVGQERLSGTYSLSSYELASRLSYRLWDTMPDDALFDRAAADELRGSGLVAEIDRMLADPRAQGSIREFFAEWMRLDELPDTAVFANDPVYAVFAGNDVPTIEFRQAMLDDALALVGHTLADGQGRLADLFTSTQVFPQNDLLARIYGVPQWTEGTSPPVAPDRPGLLTRAAMLYQSTRTGHTNPIMKGVFIRREILCDEIPPPPDNAAVVAASTPIPLEATRRKTAELLTETPGSTCASCHSTVINPLGYVFEGFDGLGRTRTTERVLAETTGAVLAETPVETTTAPHVTPEDGESVSTPDELTQRILASGKLETCAARQYFRYTFGRQENDELDGCTLVRLQEAAADEGGTLRSFIRTVMLDPAFQERTFDL